MSAARPQTTTGDPFNSGKGQIQGASGGDHSRRNSRNKKYNQERNDNEEIPIVLRSYRYSVNSNNPAETFERVTQEIAQYIATEIQGAGYMRRALMDLQEPTILPPPKPVAPTELADNADDHSKALYEIDKAHHESDMEVWKEEIKLVARRRMEQKTTILPSVYAVVWRQCTLEMKELLSLLMSSRRLTKLTMSSRCFDLFDHQLS